jgi:sulfur-carrier protein
MQIKVKYFGAFAEQTGKTEEVIILDETGLEVQDFRSYCFQKYGLEDDDSIRVAVNQMINKKGFLENGDEVAFLPPYAGG